MRTVVILLLTTIGAITAIGVFPNNSSILSVAQSVQNPMRVRVVPQFVLGRFTGHKSIEVLSMVDKIKIQSITLNRGNCEHQLLEWKTTGMSVDMTSEGWVLEGHKYKIIDIPSEKIWKRAGTLTLKYGELEEIGTNCQEILEMTIKTDQGEFRY